MTVICPNSTDHVIMNPLVILFLAIGFYNVQAFPLTSSVDNYLLEDNLYRYFLGISNPQDTENQAIKEAVENAYFNAITEVHGTEVEISQKSTSNMTDTNLSKVSLIKTKSIKFKSFEKIDQKVSESMFRFIAKVLFRYSKLEIRKEQARLINEDNLKKVANLNTDLTPALNQVGTSQSIIQLGRLEFRSFSDGKEVTEADIEIDEKKFASTPLLIGNRFSLGEHKINIKHSLYENYEGTFSVDGSDHQRIDINLRKATGSITFYSNPSNAQVYVNDNLFGETPIKIETISTGKPVSIKLKHIGYYDQLFDGISLQKNENLILNPTLNRINPPTISLGLNRSTPVENSIDSFKGDENVCSTSDLSENDSEKSTCEDRE